MLGHFVRSGWLYFHPAPEQGKDRQMRQGLRVGSGQLLRLPRMRSDKSESASSAIHVGRLRPDRVPALNTLAMTSCLAGEGVWVSSDKHTPDQRLASSGRSFLRIFQLPEVHESHRARLNPRRKDAHSLLGSFRCRTLGLSEMSLCLNTGRWLDVEDDVCHSVPGQNLVQDLHCRNCVSVPC